MRLNQKRVQDSAMQLTKHTDFAFRILIFLATLEDELTTIMTITERFALSKSHATKIVNKLVHHGWIKSVRGKYGGIRLAVPPREISVRELVELMEQTLEPVNCYTPPCVLNNVCRLKGVLWQAQNHYLDHLEKFTLEDLLDRKTTQALQVISIP